MSSEQPVQGKGPTFIKRRARVLSLSILGCAMVLLLGHFLRQLNIVVNPIVWSSTQIISALLSFTIAANVLVKYHGNGHRVSLFFGLTFGILGLIDLAAIIEFYRDSGLRGYDSRVPLAWMIGQIILGLLFLISLAADKKLSWPREPRRNVVAVLALVLAIAFMVTLPFIFVTRGLPIYSDRPISRPWDLFVAAIFIAAVVVLKRISGRDSQAFDAALAWVAGMNAAGHLIASESIRSMDVPAVFAQLVNTGSYVLLLGATLFDNARLFGQVRTLAISDSLTGLANYRRMVDVLQAELERSGRTNRPFSLLLMDLDGLKIINDHYGHLTGSRALTRVADILQLHCRSIDTAARYGGDEFALVLPESDMFAAQLVADRIQNRLQADEEEPALRLSIGIATFPHCGVTVQQMLEQADKVLYTMKARTKKGRTQKRGQ
jgi:diguanylate cyclase (GGDEF)-like protein